MEVCPLQDTAHPPLRRTPAYCPSRALDLEKRKPAPCRTACPLGVNVQAYMALTAASRFDEALDVIRRDNPLPGICGRVCHHPCEESCRRAEVDEAVAICSVKRFLADRELPGKRPRFDETGKDRRPERIAVIGAGPAGLTAAHFLNRAGFAVTVFEAHHEAGGMLRLGINAFRLPRAVLDDEIRAIADSGVEIRTGTAIENLQGLFDEGFQAVLVCTGAHRDLRLDIPGDDAEGVLGAVAMLRSLHTGKLASLGRHVAVIGGGNSAFDAARAAVRLGAESVTVYYRREREDMPASLSEILEAEEEGVRIEFRCAPVRIDVRNGKAAGLDSHPDENGETRRKRAPPAGTHSGLRVHRPGGPGHRGHRAAAAPFGPAGSREDGFRRKGERGQEILRLPPRSVCRGRCGDGPRHGGRLHGAGQAGRRTHCGLAQGRQDFTRRYRGDAQRRGIPGCPGRSAEACARPRCPCARRPGDSRISARSRRAFRKSRP